MTLSIAQANLFTTQEQCIDAAANAIKDYRATMEKVVESWLKNNLGTIEQLAEAIGRSPKTLKTDYVSALRKQGRLPASGKSRTAPRKKRSGCSGNPEQNVENSKPEIEQVSVTVEDSPEPTPEPTPTLNAPPESAPEPAPTPSVPSAGSLTPDLNRPITPTGKLNKSMKKIIKREKVSGELRMKAVSELSQLKSQLDNTWQTAQGERKRLGASIHAKDVEIAEQQLARDGCVGICKSLTKIAEEAEAVRKAARQALYHLHFVEMP